MESNLKNTYLNAWRHRFEQNNQLMEKRRIELRHLAEKIAEFLKKEYGLEEIYLIGSIVSDRPLSALSDIDLVVKGIPDADYFPVLSHIYDLLPVDVTLDLITFETATPSIIDKIKSEGIRL
jgi:predicted nucleotidyltransferase